MTDKKEDNGDTSKDKGKLTMSKPNKLSLTKTVESGKVTQNFTHGRSKKVTVEVRKTRTFSRKAGGVGMEETTSSPKPLDIKLSAPKVDLASLQVRDKRQIDKATSEVVRPEPEKKPEVKKGEVVIPPRSNKDSVIVAPKSVITEAPRKQKAKVAEPKEEKKKIRLKQDDNRRSSNKLTVQQALEYQEERMRSLASIKRQRDKSKKDGAGDSKEKITRDVVVPEVISVQDLANRMAERVADVIKSLMKLGTMASASQSIDADTAELVIEEFGHRIKRVTEGDVENILVDAEDDDPAKMKSRAPVVTIMGHVDHGKTSLLDALRKTAVVEGEAGGITQHIGAYQVKAGGEKVTFLDTPGHAAFTAMRSRGAKATDIVVIVVAADDGIKMQTEEAISHAKAAEVPIIVAINKMDKPEADPQRVKNELMNYELVPEEFGGDIQVVEVSAKTRTGLDTLVETILLQAEIMELKANPERNASGVVIEAKIDKGRGVAATLLVQRGTLKVGDIVVAGGSWGKCRAIVDDQHKRLKKAIPSQPVEILGLSEAPMAGDEFAVVESEKTARDISEYRIRQEKQRVSAVTAKSLDQLFADAGNDELKEMTVIIKGDVQGSVEAIIGSLEKFKNDEVEIKTVHSGVGAISESDVSLAQATGAIIFGFNVRAVGGAKALAEKEHVDIRYYSVIYDLVDDVRDAISGMLSPERREEMIGYAEIRDVFNITKVGKVAGCYVTDGEVRRGAGVRLLRDNVVIHEGKLKTLKRFKEEVKEVKQGYECGMAFENYDDIKVGDVIEAYEIKEISRTIDG